MKSTTSGIFVPASERGIDSSPHTGLPTHRQNQSDGPALPLCSQRGGPISTNQRWNSSLPYQAIRPYPQNDGPQLVDDLIRQFRLGCNLRIPLTRAAFNSSTNSTSFGSRPNSLATYSRGPYPAAGSRTLLNSNSPTQSVDDEMLDGIQLIKHDLN